MAAFQSISWGCGWEWEWEWKWTDWAICFGSSVPKYVDTGHWTIWEGNENTPKIRVSKSEYGVIQV